MTKKSVQVSDEDQRSFHRKYRPESLDRIIGHEAAVTRLKGMLLKPPAALLITGPTSAGKTTLARAFAAEINGRPIEQQQDYKEVNAGTTRGIDDMRELEKLSKFKPMNKKRVICIDECQQLISNKAAAMCIEADTKIVTNKGDISAEELHKLIETGEEIYVLSFNHKLEKVEWEKIIASKKRNSSKKTVNLGGNANVTSNHPVFTKENGYIDAELTNELTAIQIRRK